MSVIIGMFFVAIAIGVSIWVERRRVTVKEPEVATAKVPVWWQGIFVHPGHTWVEVLNPSQVAVGADEFTNAVFGSVRDLRLPEEGAMIYQGEKAWSLKRGKRELVQSAPITGRVIEVNRAVIENPNLLAERDLKTNWLLKIQPAGLKRQLRNLLHGNILTRWNQAVKEQLVGVLGMAGFPVLQDGGEVTPDLGDKLTDQQWGKAKREFFN